MRISNVIQGFTPPKYPKSRLYLSYYSHLATLKDHLPVVTASSRLKPLLQDLPGSGGDYVPTI